MNSTYRDSREPIRGIDKEASGSYLEEMRAVGLKILKNKLSEYASALPPPGKQCWSPTATSWWRSSVRHAAGATELPDVLLAEAVRKGGLRRPGCRPATHRPTARGRSCRRVAGACRGSEPVIYVDTSVALGEILAEDRSPRSGFWDQSLVSSRLIEHEIWVRIHARKVADSHGEHARWLLGRLALVELVSPVLARAREPFPAPVRTLDALHLATMEFAAKG